jgi:hypothetical protein
VGGYGYGAYFTPSCGPVEVSQTLLVVQAATLTANHGVAVR